MSEETNTQTTEEAPGKQYTQKELEDMRKAHESYYKGEIKRLKLEEEYERLVADIEEHKARGLHSIIRIAQMTAGPQQEAPQEPEKESKEGPKKEAAPEKPVKKGKRTLSK